MPSSSSSSSSESGEDPHESSLAESTSAGKQPAATETSSSSSKDPERPKQKGFQRKFRFISAQDDGGASRKQARVHVMREVMRHKRWEQEEGLKQGGGSKPKEYKYVDWTKRGTEEERRAARGNKEDDSTESESQEPSEGSTPFKLEPSSSGSGSKAKNSPTRPSLEDTQTTEFQRRPHLRRRSTGSSRKGKEATQAPSESTILSQEPVDPLSTLPTNMTPRDYELASYYLRIIPSSHFNIVGAGICNPLRDVSLREAVRDPAVLHSLILAYAARHQAHVQGLGETAESVSHKSKAIYIINHRLSVNTTSPSDGTVLAALSLTTLEDRWGKYDAAWVHMRGVQQMIRNRGGPDDFAENWVLSLLINWTDYMITGYDVSGASLSYSPSSPELESAVPHSSPQSDEYFASSHGHQASATNSPAIELPGIIQIRNYASQFLIALHNFESLAQLHQVGDLGIANPRRRAIFQPGTPLHRILSAPTGNPPFDHALRSGNEGYTTPYRLHTTARIATLLYLNAALWDHRSSPLESERFLKVVSLNLVENNLDVEPQPSLLLQPDPSMSMSPLSPPPSTSTFTHRVSTPAAPPATTNIELLLWLLMKHDAQSRTGSPERMWFVGRMLKVAKRLGGESWERLGGTLLAFLDFDNDFLYAGDSLVGPGMSDERIRGEILSLGGAAGGGFGEGGGES